MAKYQKENKLENKIVNKFIFWFQKDRLNFKLFYFQAALDYLLKFGSSFELPLKALHHLSEGYLTSF